MYVQKLKNEGQLRYFVQNAKCEEEFLAETSRNNVIKIHPSCSIQNSLAPFSRLSMILEGV